MDLDAIHSLYPLLYDNKENAGEFFLNFDTKKTEHKVTLIEGSADSVEAPKALLNYHTHPISCYLGEKTTWGWPSGEDMRESIIFGLKGSICHAIPSVEGLYICQVNPCILQSLIHIDELIEKILSKNPEKYKDL
jgi:hypothetical protein